MSKVVGVRFREGERIQCFDTSHFVLREGDKVIVKTEQGAGLCEVVVAPRLINPEIHRNLKSIYRLANEEDLSQHEKNKELEAVAYQFCIERIKAREMQMKLITTEVLFDGSKVIFYYTADGRVDFRELVKDLVSRFRIRIEMRQIAVRNEAAKLGGIGCCGRTICCSSFLNSFDPISVKMAKEQNVPLNPAKISGLCGRLMCCLSFEYQNYVDQKKNMPKLGKRVMTKQGPGKVLRQNIMARTYTVALADGNEIEIDANENQ
ncbi:MAG: stage 0 sporulation family protein [Deltaproteobacteria bacterium]|nr:stage 0 sporulation family protein [Deltaproteobacteria bacterium]